MYVMMYYLLFESIGISLNWKCTNEELYLNKMRSRNVFKNFIELKIEN